MSLADIIQKFDWASLALFVLFALPGFISMQVWDRIMPTGERPLKDSIPEAFAFGILTAAIALPGLVIANPSNPWAIYFSIFGALVVLPALLPFLLKWAILWLNRRSIILGPTHNSWDAVFLRREPLLVIVHLKDGRRIGGYYGPNSSAGLYPASGHLYLETLWKLDDDGNFVASVPRSRGIILRPEDYAFVELFSTR